jgi:hypothetical protein
MANSMGGLRKNTNRMNAMFQNAGYQIGDFAVQVQSGQNVLVAFSQQGAQLAGLLPGLTGALTGVGLVVGTSLLRAFTEGGTAFKSFSELIEQAVESTNAYADALNLLMPMPMLLGALKRLLILSLALKFLSSLGLNCAKS